MTPIQENRVFAGPNAIRDFLNLENHPPTPLVELPEDFLGSLATKKVRIFGKMQNLNMLRNVKAQQVAGMRDRANLSGVHTLVESTSGSTGHILPIFAHAYGIDNVEVIVSPNVTKSKRLMMQLTGAKIRESKNGIPEARQLGEQKGWRNLGQYSNWHNPIAMQLLAEEVDNQSRGEISVYVAGMGTAATIMGGQFYYGDDVKMVGVILENGHIVPGVRKYEDLQKDFEWEESSIAWVTMQRKPSFLMSIKLCRIGLLAGPSSGFALAGALKFLRIADSTRKLDELRNNKGEVNVVVIFADGPDLYIEEYEAYLE